MIKRASIKGGGQWEGFRKRQDGESEKKCGKWVPIPEGKTALGEKDICVKLILERGVRSPKGLGLN